MENITIGLALDVTILCQMDIGSKCGNHIWVSLASAGRRSNCKLA
jgi:hypothetical protein